MLQNSNGQVIVGTLVPDNMVGRLTVRPILRSLDVAGMSGVNVNTNAAPAGLFVKMIIYNSKNSSAMIGNITVKVGDVIKGFKIVAIEKDLVIVQSPAGVKKSLRMGDDLK